MPSVETLEAALTVHGWVRSGNTLTFTYEGQELARVLLDDLQTLYALHGVRWIDVLETSIHEARKRAGTPPDAEPLYSWINPAE